MNVKHGLEKIVKEQYEWLNEREQDELVGKTLKRLAYRVARGFRTCITCRKDLQPIHFAQDRSSKDGLSSRCKQCDRDRRRGKAQAPLIPQE